MNKKLLTLGTITTSIIPLAMSISCSKEEAKKNLERYSIYFDKKENMVVVDRSTLSKKIIESTEFKNAIKEVNAQLKDESLSSTKAMDLYYDFQKKYFNENKGIEKLMEDAKWKWEYFKGYYNKLLEQFHQHPEAIGIINIGAAVYYTSETKQVQVISKGKNFEKYCYQKTSGNYIGEISKAWKDLYDGKLHSDYAEINKNQEIHWKDINIDLAYKYYSEEFKDRIPKWKEDLKKDDLSNKERSAILDKIWLEEQKHKLPKELFVLMSI